MTNDVSFQEKDGEIVSIGFEAPFAGRGRRKKMREGLEDSLVPGNGL